MAMEIKIGADPEVFIKDNGTGKLISAAGLFPGTKEAPFKVERGAIQVDGMAAEYNIDPASTADEFVYNNLVVLKQLRDIIKERNPDLDFEFVFTPVAEFGAKLIAAQPEENRILGCTPDYNAYTGGLANPTPDAEMPFRTASGHIHIGWGEDFDITDDEHIEACCMMVKQLDHSVGARSLLWEHKSGARRRELYGKAGAFRPKPYGVEYRTPSNCWVGNIAFMEVMFNDTLRAFNELVAGARYYEWYGLESRIVKYINSHDVHNIGYEFVKPVKYKKLDVSTKTIDQLILNSYYFNQKVAVKNLVAGFEKIAINVRGDDIIGIDLADIDDAEEG